MGDRAGNERSDRELIRERYLNLLERHNSQLLLDEGIKEQVLGQLDSVVAAALATLGVETPSELKSRQGLSLSATIGRGRAVSGVHPSQSLHAASLIFEAALPAISATLAAAGQAQPCEQAALALNRSIMERMAVAAEFYIGFLLEKVQASHRDERRRLSRDLHDILAPAIAVGLQNLQLRDVYATSDPALAEAKLALARKAMNDALATMRTLAAESRESVGRNGLEYAIGSVLKRFPDVKSRLSVIGDPTGMPEPYQEELFLIVSEASRNAFAHADPTMVSVDMDIRDHEVIALISDDGGGFESETAETNSGRLGLTSMRERAELLGGSLSIASNVGAGTTVTVRLPLPNAGRGVVPQGATEAGQT